MTSARGLVQPLRVCCLLLVLCAVSFRWANAGTTKAGDSCTVAYLVSVGNTTEGVTIDIFLDASESLSDGQQLGRQKLTSDLASGHYLSPWCGMDLLRCRDLFVKRISANKTDQYIVFAPLVSEILLIELVHDGYSLKYEGFTIIELPYNYGCSPTTFFPIFHTIFAACINTESPLYTMFEIRLDHNSLKDTILTVPLIDFESIDPHPQLSNFVFASLDEDSGSQYVVFTLDSKVYAFIPLDHTFYQLSFLESCGSVRRLEYAGDSVLMAYCADSDIVEYYDLDSYEVLNHTSTDRDGVPYLCPNRDKHFSVFSTYIQYGVWSTNSLENFLIPSEFNFNSGVCLGSESEVNDTYFAYIDSLDGVFVLDPKNARLGNLSQKACQNLCQPLMTFHNRYLVFQEQFRGSENVIVVDMKNSFSRIIEAWGTKADLLTVIMETCRGEDPAGGGATEASNNDHGGGSGMETWKIAVIVPVVMSIAIIVVLVSLLVVVVYIRRRNARPRYPTQVEDDGGHGVNGDGSSRPDTEQSTVGTYRPLCEESSESLSSERVSAATFMQPSPEENTANCLGTPNGHIPLDTLQPKLATVEEESSESVPPVPQPSGLSSSPVANTQPSGVPSAAQTRLPEETTEPANTTPAHQVESASDSTSQADVPVTVQDLSSSSSSEGCLENVDDRTPLLVPPHMPVPPEEASHAVISKHRRESEMGDDPEVMRKKNYREKAAKVFQGKK